MCKRRETVQEHKLHRKIRAATISDIPCIVELKTVPSLVFIVTVNSYESELWFPKRLASKAVFRSKQSNGSHDTCTTSASWMFANSAGLWGRGGEGGGGGGSGHSG